MTENKKPKLSDFELPAFIDPSGEKAYDAYRKAKNEYMKNKRAKQIEESWRSHFHVSNSEVCIIGNMTCWKCKEKISGDYLVEEKSNFMLRGNEHDECFIFHRQCSSDNVEWFKFDAKQKENQANETFVFHENGDGSFSILNHDKTKWVVALHLNGEMTVHKQRSVMTRIVDCYNAMQGIENPTEWVKETANIASNDPDFNGYMMQIGQLENRVNELTAQKEKLINLLEWWQNEWEVDATPAQKANNYSIELAIKEAIDESKRFASDESAL